MKKFYAAIWNFGEDYYRITGCDFFRPVHSIWPGFAPWLFGKMIGVKPIRIK